MAYEPHRIPAVPSYAPTEKARALRTGALEETLQGDFEPAADERWVLPACVMLCGRREAHDMWGGPSFVHRLPPTLTPHVRFVLRSVCYCATIVMRQEGWRWVPCAEGNRVLPPTPTPFHLLCTHTPHTHIPAAP